MSKSFYITTTLPYVNADPHIGFALELVQADIIARAKKLQGNEVFFNTGTDEHGLKVYRAAGAANLPPQDYVDGFAKRYLELGQELNISANAFIRTTSPAHVAAAGELWQRCKKDIEKRSFAGLYCVGCEAFIKESDLVDGKCPDHKIAPEQVEEENWFFKVSDEYRSKILDYLKKDKVIIPESRRLEAMEFVKNGFGDFSISRPKERLPWGIPVPGDESQVMYVWFDALTNYISTLGWPEEGGNFNQFWLAGETVQLAGKDQVRFQSLMWQVMLLAAGIKQTDTVMYHGHITSGGQKMSKSIGNVVNPFDLVKEYGADAVRYFLARHINPFEDSDFTLERFKESYNSGLANGLGNLVSRLMKMVETSGVGARNQDLDIFSKTLDKTHETEYLKDYQFNQAMDSIWGLISQADAYIQTNQTFKLIGVDIPNTQIQIQTLLLELIKISFRLRPFMPETAQKIEDLIKSNKVPESPLFPRK